MKFKGESNWWFAIPIVGLLIVAITRLDRLAYLFFFLSLIPLARRWFYHSKMKKT
jgi:hypothetical protein